MRINLVQFKKILLIFISIITTLYVYRSIFSGRLLGDAFDARLQIVLHEHWWHWLNGKTAFRDTGFYFPFDKSLGFSDVFLLQGFIYSIFRLVNFDIANSWTLTTMFVVVLGNIGWTVIAWNYLKNYFYQILFIIAIISSMSFVNYFTLNPNASGYTLISWIILLYLQAKNEKNINKKNIKYNFLILVILVYVFTCWYGAFFLIFTFIIKTILDLIFVKDYKRINLKKINLHLLVFFIPFYLFFVWLFVYIYLPTLNEADRTREELINGSPQLELLPNGASLPGTGLNGAIFSPLYNFLGLNIDREYAFGIGLFVFIAAVIVGIQYFKFNFKNYSSFAWPVAIILTYLIFVVFGDNFSLFSILFEFVPGFNSIRFPSRYVILLGYFLIFSIFYFLDRKSNFTKNRFKGFLFSIFLLILVLDQFRFPFQGWGKEQLVNKELFAQSEEIKQKCDYFYFDYPGGWWFDQIEAMTFSMQIGVPTVNGYSGGFPKDYPKESFFSEEMPLNIFSWIGRIPTHLKGCFVTGRTPVHPLSSNLIAVDLVGFTPTESKNEDFWNWAVTENPYIYIVNLTKNNLKINFRIKTSQCNLSGDLSIKDSRDSELYKTIINQDSKDIEFILDFKTDIVKKIDLLNNLKPCKIGNDPRPLYFEVKNLKYQTL